KVAVALLLNDEDNEDTFCFGVPLELYVLWHQYPWNLGLLVCQMKHLISEATSYASILTLVTFTLERYLAICGSPKSPPVAATLNTNSCDHLKRIALRNIIIIWMLSFLGAAPLTLFAQINYVYIKQMPVYESAWCGVPFNQPHRIWETIVIMSTILFFVIPLTVISLLYYFIARTLKKATKLDPFHNPDLQLTDQRSSRKIIQSRKIVIRLLVAIVIAFTICWTPFHAQRLLFIYASIHTQWPDDLRQINQIFFLVAGVLYYLNSTINPILYSAMSTRFRLAFNLYVSGCCGKSNSKHGSRSNSSANRHRATPSKSNSDNAACPNVMNGRGVISKVQWNRNLNYLEV
ncbi:alpha-1B adrenergic receptor-like protein, partial [Leptotrombidium deliense]